MKWWGKLLVSIGICVAAFAIWSAVKRYRVESSISELSEEICENKIHREVPSPDGRQKAIAFTHDCGAAGYPHTIVAILRKSGGIPKHQPIEQRLAAGAWEGYCNVTILWRDDRTVLVEENWGGEEESSAPKFERLKVETDGRGGILKVSPMDISEPWP
jgi:hypothetical protein